MINGNCTILQVSSTYAICYLITFFKFISWYCYKVPCTPFIKHTVALFSLIALLGNCKQLRPFVLVPHRKFQQSYSGFRQCSVAEVRINSDRRGPRELCRQIRVRRCCWMLFSHPKKIYLGAHCALRIGRGSSRWWMEFQRCRSRGEGLPGRAIALASAWCCRWFSKRDILERAGQRNNWVGVRHKVLQTSRN